MENPNIPHNEVIKFLSKIAFYIYWSFGIWSRDQLLLNRYLFAPVTFTEKLKWLSRVTLVIPVCTCAPASSSSQTSCLSFLQHHKVLLTVASVFSCPVDTVLPCSSSQHMACAWTFVFPHALYNCPVHSQQRPAQFLLKLQWFMYHCGQKLRLYNVFPIHEHKLSSFM